MLNLSRSLGVEELGNQCVCVILIHSCIYEVRRTCEVVDQGRYFPCILLLLQGFTSAEYRSAKRREDAFLGGHASNQVDQCQQDGVFHHGRSS